MRKLVVGPQFSVKRFHHEDTKTRSLMNRMPGRDIIPISEKTERYARSIVDSAYRVHTSLSPGLIESVYETCLVHEFTKRGIVVESQVKLPIIYDEIQLDAGLRLDLRVENSIIVEIKAVERLLPVHEAQLLTYLKLTDMRLGLLMNFNVPLTKDGIRRLFL